jgi:hypothetical protein
MKTKTLVLSAALAVAGCSQSISDQFEDLCEYQKNNDPEAYASSEKACKHSKLLDIEHKEVILKAYEDLKAARAAVESSGGQ